MLLCGTVLVFELKKQIDKAHEDYMVDKSIEALKAHNLFDPKKVIFISFSRNICERIAALCPGFTNQYLERDLTPDEVFAKGVNGIDYHQSAFNEHPEWVGQAHKNKMSVNVWTVNKKEDIQKMIDEAILKAVTEGVEDPQEEPQEETVEEQVEKAVAKALEPFMKQEGLPTNLNAMEGVKKSADEHYLHGLL